MRRFLQKILLRPVQRLSARYASRPQRERVFGALSDLHAGIRKGEQGRGRILSFEAVAGKFIIFSDQHKGGGNGADDFMVCAPAYLHALEHYNREGFHLIVSGDCEELWENSWTSVRKAHAQSFERECAFHKRGAFTKIFGNHDLIWDNDPLAPVYLRSVYGTDVPVYEGALLRTTIGGRQFDLLCTHGHQGDEASDGNWFSKFFVARIWAPLQAWLEINPNTPAYDATLKSLHNSLMYEWSAAQQQLLLITGHTHQPVFESLTHLERLYRSLLHARAASDDVAIAATEAEIRKRKFQYHSVGENYLSLKPTYFNTGCCCYANGSITGIEISEGALRLICWTRSGTAFVRSVLEEAPLEELAAALQAPKAGLSEMQ